MEMAPHVYPEKAPPASPIGEGLLNLGLVLAIGTWATVVMSIIGLFVLYP